MKDNIVLLIWVLVWSLYSLIDIIDFSFQVGDKNQVIIEKVEKKEEPKTDFPKGSW